MENTRIAAVTCHCEPGEIGRNLARMFQYASEAAARGADIVCFPELNVTGYSVRKTHSSSGLESDGKTVQKVLDFARDKKILILFGFVENKQQGLPHATHMAAYPDGTRRIYRKLHLAPPEKTRFTPGDKIPVFEYKGLKFGVQLCYDAHFPEISTIMAENGADVIFMPHASPRGTPEDKYHSWMRHLTARAFDNAVFVVVCNQAGKNGAGLDFPGITLAIGPSGKVLHKDVSGQEGIMLLELTSDQLQEVRGHRMRYFFPNRRPGLYERHWLRTDTD